MVWKQLGSWQSHNDLVAVSIQRLISFYPALRMDNGYFSPVCSKGPELHIPGDPYVHCYSSSTPHTTTITQTVLRLSPHANKTLYCEIVQR